jgi:HB1, ASXL, restriction endonuclease HTH domain
MSIRKLIEGGVRYGYQERDQEGRYKSGTKAEEVTTKATSNGKLSALDAAAKVLGDAKEPMNTKRMIEAMVAKGYWKSPGGQTPHATLYSAMLREVETKGAGPLQEVRPRHVHAAILSERQKP